MEKSFLGKTNMEITRIGLGLAEVFRQQTKISDQESSNFLNSVLDQGINFLDTAPCYGITEKIIGRTVSNRRNEYYLATKAGHVTGGYSGTEWTGKTITDSIDRSLKDLSTDYLDLVQLHSCEIDILENSDCIESLIKAQEAGKTRFIGYSGDNDAAAWAINSGIFAISLVCSHPIRRLIKITGMKTFVAKIICSRDLSPSKFSGIGAYL